MRAYAYFFFLRPAMFGIAAAAVLALGACGARGAASVGGAAGISGNKPTAPAATTGTVGILLTDGPTGTFCQILATIERIDLLGTGAPTNVYTGAQTVNVLAMRNFSDVFVVDPGVHVGSYDTIRLTLSDLALVECDDAGNPEHSSGREHPRLPGNGKLDLKPRGSFQVVGGETLVIQLDMDMEKSLHVNRTGNGKWQFRPAVFVKIKPDETKLVRVFGQVHGFDGTTFELCPVEPASSADDERLAGGDPTGDDDGGRCLDVLTNGITGIFDEAGIRVGSDALVNGNLLTAIGFLSQRDDDDGGDSQRHDLRLDAVVVEMGPQGTFAHLQGGVVPEPGDNGSFMFNATPHDDAADAIDVLLLAGTRIFAIGSNDELSPAALQRGTTGEVDGVFIDPATGLEPLRSSLVVLDEDQAPALAVADAGIRTIPGDDDVVPEHRRIIVDTPSLAGRCVKTDAHTRYLRITEAPGSSETAEILFTDLAVGDKVDVYGRSDAAEPGCVLADTVQNYIVAPWGSTAGQRLQGLSR